MTHRYYQIAVAQATRTADIFIYGDITGSAEIIDAILDTETGAVSARGIVHEIDDLDVDTINVYINSYGGEVAEALAIYSALKRHKAAIHTHCDGFACSAATIVFCAGDQRTMGSIALMMIHNASMHLGSATAGEMRKAAEDLDKITAASVEAYKAVSNLSESKIKELMDHETWLTAKECLDFGFATDIAEDDAEAAPQQAAFASVRDAILQRQENLSIDCRLTQIMDAVHEMQEALQAMSDAPEDPEEPDEPEPPKSFIDRYIRRT